VTPNFYPSTWTLQKPCPYLDRKYFDSNQLVDLTSH
jgi:hypothetical protein